MNFKKVNKICLHCSKTLVLKNNRDIGRKKFCSRSCKNSWAWENKPWDMSWYKLGSTPESNAKKVNKLDKNGRYKKDRDSLKCRPSPELNEWKKIVFERDGNYCKLCNSTEKLIVDHIKSYNLFPDLRFDPKNGRVLCDKCHKKTKTYGVYSTKRWANVQK